MKKNKRLIILFSIILVLCIIAGYTVYKSYNRGQKNIEEEINLGASMSQVDVYEGGSSSSEPCCDTCGNNSFCLANCKSCDSSKESESSGDGHSSSSLWDGIVQGVTDFISGIGSIISGAAAEAINPCDYVTVSLPGELSPDSTAYVYVSYDRYALPAGYNKTCSISYTIDGNSSSAKIAVVNSRPPLNIAMKDGGFEPCQKVSMSVTKSDVTTSKSITVRTNFSEDTKKRNLSGESEIPSSPERADELGKDFYGECNDKDKTNCEVHTRSLCSISPSCYYNKDTFSYCWGTDCGNGYVVEPNVNQSNCINVCYCSEEKNKCNIWAKKEWEGYEVVLDDNSNYIQDSNNCVMPAKYSYCCVDNGTLALSKKAEYKEKVQTKTCDTNWTLLENVSKDDCKIVEEKVGSCNISDISPAKQTGKAKECEETVSITVDEGKACTNTVNEETTSFYNIACAKTVKTNFDYGNDGKTNTIRTLYKGEGFAFGINVETTVNCKYTFYDEVWKKAYNGVINKIKKIDSNLLQYLNDASKWEKYINDNILNKNGVNDASELFRLWTVAEELRNVVKTYNEYKPNDDYNEKSEITVNTKEKGNSVITNHKLIKAVNDEGSYQKSEVSTRKLDVTGVTNPQNYILSSKTPRKVKLIPKRTCIDRGTGKITTIDGSKCPNNTIDGGNKIYINQTTDVTVGNNLYRIEIDVDGLGANDSNVTNNKCNLKVEESKYIYRPIDLENPFINSSWKKGKNWVNDKFDFTKVINKDTWQDNSKQKVITLISKDIAAIKESNARAWKDNNSPYMGLCDRQSEKLQDEITKKLCSLIK